jgi:hypothetical protein
LPTIRLLNEAPHQLPPQNNKGIIAKQRRFHTARVKNRSDAVSSGCALPCMNVQHWLADSPDDAEDAYVSIVCQDVHKTSLHQ